MAELDRQIRQEERGVDMAGVIGRENDRTFYVAQVFEATHSGRGDQACHGSSQVVHDHGAGETGRVAPRPFVVVLEPDLALGVGTLDGRGPRRRRQGKADRPRPAEESSRSGPRPGPRHQ
jgi:hypothetical protein